MPLKRITVLVVDDHPLLRQAVVRVLERIALVESVCQSEGGARAVARYADLRPDVTLMDVQMPGVDGIEALEAIRNLDSNACVLLMTLHPNDARMRRALQAGASGFVPKSLLLRHLSDAIRIVHEGGAYFATDAGLGAAAEPLDRLSEGEASLLRQVSAGQNDEEIADRIGIPVEVVMRIVANVVAKLSARDRWDAVSIALQRRLIERD